MAESEVQHKAMRVYRALVGVRPEWGGGLVLLCGPGRASDGAPAAVSIAGGATLAVDADATAMKAAMRAGALDFVVNTLDEALRALKNEVRKRRPLGVGLVADVDATLAEMVERGVEPDLHIVTSGGAEFRSAATAELAIPDGGHGEYFLSATDAAGLAAIDDALLTVIPANDVVRRRWIERVPRYIREVRGGGRWIWLSKSELQQLRMRMPQVPSI